MSAHIFHDKYAPLRPKHLGDDDWGIMDILKVSIQITTASILTDRCETVRFKGTKYLTHRITYQSYHHDILPASSRNEISHTLYLGSITSR